MYNIVNNNSHPTSSASHSLNSKLLASLPPVSFIECNRRDKTSKSNADKQTPSPRLRRASKSSHKVHVSHSCVHDERLDESCAMDQESSTDQMSLSDLATMMTPPSVNTYRRNSEDTVSSWGNLSLSELATILIPPLVKDVNTKETTPHWERNFRNVGRLMEDTVSANTNNSPTRED